MTLSVTDMLDVLKNPTVAIAITFSFFLSPIYALWGGLLFGSVFAAAVVRSTIGLLPNPADEEKREAYFAYIDQAAWWIATPLWAFFWPHFLGYFYYQAYGLTSVVDQEDLLWVSYVVLMVSAPALLLTLWAWWDASRTVKKSASSDSVD